MSLLNKLKTSANTTGIKGGKEKDTLGGGGVQDTGLYGFTLDSAYFTEAKSSALGIVLNLVLDSGAKYSETFYVTTGKEKGCNPYYEKNGEKTYLPSYVKMNSFVEAVTGKEISLQNTEERVVDIYDYETQTTIPTKVEMLVDLLKTTGFVGVHKIRSNKQIKGDNGYIDSPDERFTNQIDKFFNANKQTHSEQSAGVEASFVTKWVEKFGNNVIDRYKEVKGVAAGAPRATPPAQTPAGQASAPADDDLFGDE